MAAASPQRLRAPRRTSAPPWTNADDAERPAAVAVVKRVAAATSITRRVNNRALRGMNFLVVSLNFSSFRRPVVKRGMDSGMDRWAGGN